MNKQKKKPTPNPHIATEQGIHGYDRGYFMQQQERKESTSATPNSHINAEQGIHG